jgi:hypothetical protein
LQGARGGHKAEEMAQVQQQRRDGEDVLMKEAEGEVDQSGDAAGVKCSRCAKKGHFAAACKAEIYCVICDKRNEHVNHKCPVLKITFRGRHCLGPRRSRGWRALLSRGQGSDGGGEEAA